jgi:hypothetical protein
MQFERDVLSDARLKDKVICFVAVSIWAGAPSRSDANRTGTRNQAVWLEDGRLSPDSEFVCPACL